MMTGKRVQMGALMTLLFCFGLSNPMQGQVYVAKTQHLGIHEGLSDAVVTCIAKTGDNEVWIGTEDGLNRFDGFRFQEFNVLNSKLNSNDIRALIEDNEGRLIVETQIRGSYPSIRTLFIFQPESGDFIPFDQVYGPVPFNISITRNIYLVHHDLIVLTESDEAWKWEAGIATWKKIALPDQFIPSHYYEGYLFSTSDRNAKVLKMEDTGKWNSEDTAMLVHTIRSILGLQGGLNIASILDGSRWNRDHHIHWLAIENNIIGIDSSGSAISFYSGEHALSFSRNVRDIYVDDQDLLYVGTEDGMYLISVEPVLFNRYAIADKDSAATRNHNYSCRGMAVIDPYLYVNQPQGVYRYQLHSNDPPEQICSVIRMFPMQVADDRYLLFGRTLLMRYNAASGLMDTLIRLGFLQNNPMWSVFITNNKYYLGLNEGAYILDRRLLDTKHEMKGCQVESELAKYTVYHITGLNDGRIAFSTSGGLFIGGDDDCHPHRISFHYENGQKAIFSQCTYLLQDQDSTLWITTLDGGVVQFMLKDTTAEILFQLNRDETMPTNTSYAILPDRYGNFWISTDVGLVQLRPDRTFRLFTREDGLPDNEFNRLSYCEDKKGNLYFGGLNGVVSFDPGKFHAQQQLAYQLHILHFAQYSGWQDSLVDRTLEINRTNKINFHAGDNYFELQVGLSDLFETNEHLYEYRFKDPSAAWEPMHGNTLRINTLPYGHHLLEIRGRNASGISASNVLTISIQAHRPFYFQWWFLLLISIGIFLLLRELLLNRARQIEKLEQSVQERTQVIEQQTQALRQAEAARSRFFANISHELRTPLTLIKGPIMSLLQGSVKEDTAASYLRIVKKNAETLAERIDDLLLLSRSDAQQLHVHPISFTLHPMLELLLDNFSAGAKEKGILLKLDNHIAASQVIVADRKKLEHILANFISNAIKFMDKPGTILVKASAQDSDLLFSVQDRGPGIDKKDLERIFERFYQVENNTHDASGTGIGLSLSKEMALLMEGAVWAESLPGEGSIFYLQIPFHPSTDQPEEEISSSSYQEEEVALHTSTGRPHSRKILIVEDHRVMREFLLNELSDYQIVTAANGQEGISALMTMKNNSSLPDLIISDVMMPVKDGFEMLKEIKSNAVFGKIPVIMLTARAGVEDKLEALRIGVDDYIAKPFDTRELKVRIENLLGRRVNLHSDPGTDQAVNIDQHWLKSVEQELLKNIGDSQFTISRLADQLHISERQFHRRIKDYTGLTANMYIREVRLYEAKRLIESGAIGTVSELAYKVGFEGPDYFSRLYMERFGTRPSALL